MSRVASCIPDETALLCEGCGYILSGLPSDSRCPECGKPIAESLPELRMAPEWERSDTSRSGLWRFWQTTAAILFRPTRFYRTLATRTEKGSRWFARVHLLIASLLLGMAGGMQVQWLLGLPGLLDWLLPGTAYARSGAVGFMFIGLGGLVACGIACYGTLALVGMLAARLTAWEAAFRGYRLPYSVVLRGLNYHSPHYLPVALGAFATVAGYQLLLGLGVLDGTSGPRYLYLLCFEVVVSAAYLFWTYWVAMRNMLFANA